MHISTLKLYNFRSLSDNLFSFSSKLNLIVGSNGSGKTNILEAIYFLSVGLSFRAKRFGHLVTWEKEHLSILAESGDHTLQVQLVPSTDNRYKKAFFQNGVGVVPLKFHPQIPAVIFRPEDLQLITGSPARRRKFLDQILTRASWPYKKALTTYEHSLRQRNKILERIVLGLATTHELTFWDTLLIQHGQFIQKKRKEFVHFVNTYLGKHSLLDLRSYFLDYTPSPISQEQVTANIQTDLKRKTTGSGPHRDDFSFCANTFAQKNKELASWGSRGQQRMALLATKVAEIHYLETTFNTKCILLLDDILSELDTKNQDLIVQLFSSRQVFLTSSQLTKRLKSMVNSTCQTNLIVLQKD